MVDGIPETMDAFIQDLEQGQISRNQGDCTQSTHGPEPRPLSTTYVNHCTKFHKLHVMAKKICKAFKVITTLKNPLLNWKIVILIFCWYRKDGVTNVNKLS